jgi:hypothetical protein
MVHLRRVVVMSAAASTTLVRADEVVRVVPMARRAVAAEIWGRADPVDQGADLE